MSTHKTPHIHQINISLGGVPKLPITSAVVGTLGIEGDKQEHLKYHGGPERAMCLYSSEIIECLRDEGHPIVPGSTGENITTSGLDWSLLKPGSRLHLGEEVLIEITSYTVPCRNISASFANGDFKRISQKLHPGDSRLYARVLVGGRIKVGDMIF